MNKPLKYGLIGLGTLVVVGVAGAAIFAATFDPNRYKGEIERLAKEKTGRTLAIKGDIRMAFWPSLGAEVNGVTFSEKGASQEFVAFDKAHASVKLMPLLRGEYIVDAVSLSGLKARIVKGKDGRYNFSDLMEGEAQAKPAAEPKKTPDAGGPVVFDIANVSIERAAATYIDQAAGQEYALADLKLKTGRLAQDAQGKLDFATVATRKSPPLQVKLEVDGDYRLSGGKLSGDMVIKLDDSTIKAKFTAAEPYELDASIDKLNLDRYLGAEEPAKPAAAAQKPAPKAEADTPIDLSALKGINAKGRVQIGALEVRGLKLAEVNAQFNAANGKVTIAPHSAKLYEGSVSGELVVDANRNQIALKENLSGVAIGPLLRDFAQQDKLEGKGNVTLDVTASGKTVNEMKRTLAGIVKVNLRDGAIKGINLAEIIQKGRNLLGGSRSAAEGQSANDKSRQTDFTELNASFNVKNGVAHNEDLDAKAPLFRLGGAGDIDIPGSRLNYVAKAALVATTKGQGGAERDQVAGLTVPVKLSGTFDDLKYEVDYRAMAGQTAKSQVGEKVKERLEDKLKDDKVRDKLKGLLGR